MSTLLIRNGYVLDPVEDQLKVEDLRRADILIKDGAITGVGSFTAEMADSVIDASNKLVMPGLISAHTHVTKTLDRGLVENCPLDPWMIYTVYAGLGLSPRENYVATTLAAVELLESGTTALLDHTPPSPIDFDNQIDSVMKAFQDVGIRAVVSPMVWDLPFSQTLPLHIVEDLAGVEVLDLGPVWKAQDLLDGCRAFLERWRSRNPRLTCSLGLSGPQRCSREIMEGISGLVNQHQIPFQAHVYETKSQWIAAERAFPEGMVKYLNSVGLLGSRSSFAHSVWLGDEDINLMAETGTTAVHNPVSNLRIASGVAPIQKMRDAGIVIALGTDEAGSGDSLNMFDVMKCAALIHKLYGQRGSWVDADEVFSMCLKGGSAVIQQPVGALQPGCRADITILHMDRLFKMPKEHMIRQLVYAEKGSSVDTVLVDGEIVVSGGRVTTVDANELFLEGQEIISRMYADLPKREALFLPADLILRKMLSAVDGYATKQKRLVQMD